MHSLMYNLATHQQHSAAILASIFAGEEQRYKPTTIIMRFFLAKSI